MPTDFQLLLSDRIPCSTYVARQRSLFGIDDTGHVRLVDIHALVCVNIGLLKTVANVFYPFQFEQARLDGGLLGGKAFREGRRTG